MRIAFSFSGHRFVLLFGAAFMAIGLTMVYVAVRAAIEEAAYRQHGKVVEAIVVDKSIKRASREGNTATRYEIAYRFTATDGRAVQGVDAVGVDEWEKLAAGSSFRITYLPTAPQTSRAEESGDAVSAYVMIGIGSVFALIGGAILLHTVAQLRRERRLLREGPDA